jgi:hypothetical protein
VHPASASRRQSASRRPCAEREQGRGDIVGINRLGQIIDCAELYRIHRGGDRGDRPWRPRQALQIEPVSFDLLTTPTQEGARRSNLPIRKSRSPARSNRKLIYQAAGVVNLTTALANAVASAAIDGPDRLQKSAAS